MIIPDIFKDVPQLDIEQLRAFTVPAKYGKFVPLIRISKNAEGGVAYHVLIRDSISPYMACYNALVYLLAAASEQDKFYIGLTSPGGAVNSMEFIANAMFFTRANTRTIAIGEIDSASSMLWSIGKEVEITPLACVMFHASSGASIGISRDMAEEAIFYHRYSIQVNSFAKVRGLLTAEELQVIDTKRRDMYLTANMLADRIPNLVPLDRIDYSQFAPIIRDK